MRIVGLNIERGRVSASVVHKGIRRSEVTDSFSRDFAGDDELVDILKEKVPGWSGSRIVASIPGSRFTQRLTHFPFSDRKRIEKALPFELEDSVPFPLDEMELEHLVLHKVEKSKEKKQDTPVLGIMLPKAVLRQRLDLLASAGVDPHVVVPSYLGLYHLADRVPVEGIAVLIQGNDLCLKDGKTVKACRSFSGLQATAGIRHTFKTLETEFGVQIEKVYLLDRNDAISAELADLEIAVEQVSPDFDGSSPDDPVSLGIALSDQVNFRKGEFAYHLVDVGKRKKRRALIIAGVIAGLLAAANTGVKFFLVDSSYTRLEREITNIFREAVPDARTVVDPVRQLRTRLDEAKKKFGVLGTGSSALDIMKAVNDGIPTDVSVTFQEFALEGDKLKLQGTAESFESVDKIKSELQQSPLFAEVAVPDTRMGVDNTVKFRLDIKLKQAQ